jgi:hypothetical protein
MRRVGVFLLAALSPLVSLQATVAESAAAFHEPNAVVINLTERDLNDLLREVFVSAGGSRVHGVRERVSKGVFDLRYEAELSEPVLKLGEEGRFSLRFDIRSADVQIGRLERRIGKRLARCENAGVAVDPERPVELSLDLRFELEDGELRLVPDAVRLDDSRKDFRLIKPTRCENAILPRWLLWWVGKPRMRRRIGQLDEVLLAKAQSGADNLNGSSGLLREQWESEDGEFHLYPRALDTSDGSLLLTLAGSNLASPTVPAESPAWVVERRSGSFLALSETFLNSVLRFNFPEGTSEPRKPSGPWRKLFRSRSLYTLIPGLRGIDTSDLHFTLSFSAPEIELESIPVADAALDPTLVGEPVVSDGERALFRVNLSDFELKIWQIDEVGRSVLGTLSIDSGRIGVVPFFNILGGISFGLVENEWALSSSGIEFSEHLLAATIQEMVFAQMFETRFEPLAREALRIGDVELPTGGFRVIDDYLVIELGGETSPAPTRTDSLLASR